MSNPYRARILTKCQKRIIELGFNGMGINVLSVQDAALKYKDIVNPYIGKAKWFHITGASVIVVDTDAVNLEDTDFDRSLCHEAYHEEFSTRVEFKPTNLLEQQALKFLSEAYVEKNIASKLDDGEIPMWRDIAVKLRQHGLAYIIDFNYKGRRGELKPKSKEDWWILINLLLFLPLNPASFYFQKTGKIPLEFDINKTFPGDVFSVKLQEFYMWLEENVIKKTATQLLSTGSVNAVFHELKKIDMAIPQSTPNT